MNFHTVDATWRYSFITLAAMMLLNGCASDSRRGDAADLAIQASLAEVAHSQPLLPAPLRQLPPVALDGGIAASLSAEPRFDLRVRRLAARDLFLGLVEGTAYNIIIDPAVEGFVSLDMKDVTVPEVLEAVRRSYGYDFRLQGRQIQIYPSGVHTRIFEVNYLDLDRVGSSVTSSVSSTGRSSGSGNSATSGQTGSTTSSSTGGSQITTVGRSSFWSGICSGVAMILRDEVGRGETRSAPSEPAGGAGIGSLLGGLRGGAEPARTTAATSSPISNACEGQRYSVNAQSGLVMVRASPQELRAVEEYLDRVQQSAQRQVIIEARVLEVELGDGFQSGVNWAALSRQGANRALISQTGGGSFLGGGSVASTNGSGMNLDPAAIAGMGVGALSTTAGGIFSLAVNSDNFSAFIELLQTQGDVQVLSSPRVSTVNNQKAVIKVGSDEYFVTNINTTTDTNNTQAVNVELESFFSGVSLDVTPQIGNDGSIVLHIHPAVSDVREQTKQINSSAGSMTMPLAISSVRESDSVIRAHNGQIVMIGGLMQNTLRETVAKVPLLGDLPLVGRLFSHTRRTTSKSELVILLKPILVDDEGAAWAREVDAAARLMRQQGQPPKTN
jgi:MSHA biogenesis protein MshL